MAFLRKFFGGQHRKNKKIVDQSFDMLVNAARRPFLYRDCAMPDTPIGRFESLSAHLVLLLMRYADVGDEADTLAVEVTEQFFQDVDHSIRELGIGDAGVPKRMKKLASMFYGRMQAYETPIRENDPAALTQALERNLYPQETARGKAIENNYDRAAIERLALAMIDGFTHLQAQTDDAFLSGVFTFPTGE